MAMLDVNGTVVALPGPLAVVVIVAVGLVAALAGCTQSGDGSGLSATSSTANLAAGAFSGDTAPIVDHSARADRIENPTQADIMLAGPLPEMALGRADAKVTVVEYASLTCPYCRAFHEKTWPAFKRAYVDTGKVRYILREFPIGRSSGNAWLIARCAGPEQALKLYDRFIKRQDLWVSQEVRLDAMFKVASEAGMTRAAFDACLKNQAIIDSVKWSKERGRKLGVIGTPTFFINAKQYRSVLTMAELKKIIDPMLAARVANSSG